MTSSQWLTSLPTNVQEGDKCPVSECDGELQLFQNGDEVSLGCSQHHLTHPRRPANRDESTNFSERKAAFIATL